MTVSITDRDPTRNCPLCDGFAVDIVYPHSTLFNGVLFCYLKCSFCASVFVDPVPDQATFAKMYSKSTYHDQHYFDKDSGEYADSVLLLGKFLDRGALVLDYGCGTGDFLKALSASGFSSYGVEFDGEVAVYAASRTGSTVINISQFASNSDIPVFDAIHFGDVLEHVPDPFNTLQQCMKILKPGGILFVEGPLEINASPVYWASKLFGTVKRLVYPTAQASYPPTHLYRTASDQQKAFFYRVEPEFQLKYWQVYETGWPYAGGGHIRNFLSKIAIILSGRRVFGSECGNRFKAIFQKPGFTSMEIGSK